MKKHTVIRLVIILLLALSCQEQTPTDPVGSDPRNPSDPPAPSPSMNSYTPLGVGGGGAMSGVAINPYSSLWLVGTDMGTLFKSTDNGISWNPINHYQADFDSQLEYAVSPGFSADGQTIFHAAAGVSPKRSLDQGLTFEYMNMNLSSGERILYWSEDPQNENLIFAATTKGLFKTIDKGITWTRSNAPASKPMGTYLDHDNGNLIIYHATESKIYKSTDLGESFSVFYTPSEKIRLFTGGRDSHGLTLAFGDDDGNNACSWAMAYTSSWGQETINENLAHCGYVWISKNMASFNKTNQIVGDHLKMASNDSQTIYAVGSTYWIRQYGTKVFLSEDAGENWSLKLQQLNWDTTPFEPWPMSKIEYSAVALDVGWWDDGYESFTINKLNSNEVAGTGYFFLFSSANKGDYWDAPFTKLEDTGVAAPQKKWKTQGIEVISVYKIKHHPVTTNLIYAASADIGGMVSDDNGESFRLCKAQYNSNYDYAFDPQDDNIVFAASGNEHDYPADWHAAPTTSEGGIYRSQDRGLNWTRLTPNNSTWNRQFLSVAFDADKGHLYAGSQSKGIARSTDSGQTWNWINNGLPNGDKIIPQITIDPENGNAYALLTGDYGTWSNQMKTGIYFLDVQNGASTWTLLRGTVHYPADADSGYKVWWYPTGFAVDFSDSQRNTFWLIDYENHGNWLMSGAWKTTDRGQNWERKIQFTHPTGIMIDPNDSNNIFVSGFHQLDGNWGNGGQIFSTDAGETWKTNLTPALQHNGFSALIDPTNSDNIFYTYFGGGILKGPNPSRSPASLSLEIVTN